MTSLLRELVSVPTAWLRSISTVDVSARRVSWRAIARPTTPPPITCLVSDRDSFVSGSGLVWNSCRSHQYLVPARAGSREESRLDVALTACVKSAPTGAVELKQSLWGVHQLLTGNLATRLASILVFERFTVRSVGNFERSEVNQWGHIHSISVALV